MSMSKKAAAQLLFTPGMTTHTEAAPNGMSSREIMSTIRASQIPEEKLKEFKCQIPSIDLLLSAKAASRSGTIFSGQITAAFEVKLDMIPEHILEDPDQLIGETIVYYDDRMEPLKTTTLSPEIAIKIRGLQTSGEPFSIVLMLGYEKRS